MILKCLVFSISGFQSLFSLGRILQKEGHAVRSSEKVFHKLNRYIRFWKDISIFSEDKTFGDILLTMKKGKP